ncbi:MAG: class I SAM-dependent methyltransferase [Polyangiaceae bacterium]|nr:class I SAM-dependent methyltransferase [Polyangiaceae bacterium]
MKREVLDGYESAAPELIERFEAVSSAKLYAEVAHLLPPSGSYVLDVGAGTGRDARWLASRGCRVLAVEPVEAFRKAGAVFHPSAQIEWLDDSLPTLSRVLQRRQTFDFVLLSGVWQHIDSLQRRLAMPSLRALTAAGGTLLFSVRHGRGAPTRPCFPASTDDAITLAEQAAFRLVFRCSTESVQLVNRQAGVTWTWLAFSAV